MSKIKVGLIGAGQRGKDVYGDYALMHPENIEFVSVVEPNEIKRREFAGKHDIDPENQFESWDEFFQNDKVCDAVIIATPDKLHYEPAKLALEKGYHMLLEKPMSPNPDEVMELGKLANKNDKVFMICHVLRYTPFFQSIKRVVDSGKIGDLMSIQHNENIGYYHFAHSFVRGNWRNSDLSSPLILQKSCHDMDILLWLVDSDCTKVASFGDLGHFNEINKPDGASDRCVSCSVEGECPYSALKLYYDNVGKWPTTAITEIQKLEEVKKAVAEGPYGRCVYNCDNNVCDHQSTILEFENGVTVTFNLAAFTNQVHRSLKIMGSKGEIRAIDTTNEIEVQLFGENKKLVINPKEIGGGHGGGDTGIMEDFIASILSKDGKALTTASVSVQSHMMSFAAEESRLNNKIVLMEDYYNQF